MTIAVGLTIGIVKDAFGVVNVPPSMTDDLIPNLNVTDIDDATGAMQTFIDKGSEPVTNAWQGWLGPVFSFTVFVSFYAAKRDFIFAGIPATLMALAFIGTLAQPLQVIVTIIMIAGYGGAIWFGIRR